MNFTRPAHLVPVAAVALALLFASAAPAQYVPDWHHGVQVEHFGQRSPSSPLALTFDYPVEVFQMTAAVEVSGVISGGVLLISLESASTPLPWGGTLLVANNNLVAIGLPGGRKAPARFPVGLSWAAPILLGQAPSVSFFLQAFDLRQPSPLQSDGMNITLSSVFGS